ncbi:hypothetical protein OROGR_017541 [Orobanche gracilis]
MTNGVVTAFGTTLQLAATPDRPPLICEWSAPPLGYIKVNIDATIFSNYNIVGCGVVARDTEGEFIAWRHTRMRGHWNPEVAEACAVLGGINMALDFNWRRVIFESDCYNVVTAFKNATCRFSEFGGFIDEGLRLCKTLDDFRFTHVKREGNKFAHNVASFFSSSCEGLGVPPC